MLVEEVSIMGWKRGWMRWKKTKTKVQDVYEVGEVPGWICDLNSTANINSGQRYKAARQGWPVEDAMAGGDG